MGILNNKGKQTNNMKDICYGFDDCEVTCDGPHCKLSPKWVDSTDYSTINQLLREDEWIIKKIGDDWCDFCSERCHQDYINS